MGGCYRILAYTMNLSDFIRLSSDAELYNRQKLLTGLSEEVFPEFSQFSHRYSIQLSRNQLPLLTIDDKIQHSKYDPWKESERSLSEFDGGSQNLLILCIGAGIGYPILNALLRDEVKRVVWYEHDWHILGLALSHIDFSFFLQNGSLIIINEFPDSESFENLFRGYSADDIRLIPHRPSVLRNAKYDQIYNHFQNSLNRRLVNQATITRFDRTWSKNFIKNLPLLIKSRPVSQLFEMAKNFPAILIGAGPTLNDSISFLQVNRDKFIYIAVDTAVHILQNFDIDPDIIVTVDPQPVNRVFLQGYRGKAFIVTDPTTSYLTLRNLDCANIFFTWSPFALTEVLFQHIGSEPGEIAFGGSVSTNAYDLAIKMGCDPILFVGQDLSFPESLAHARGAILEESIKNKEHRLFRFELHNYRQIYALPPLFVQNYEGNPVKTNHKLQIFIQWFNSRIRSDRENGSNVYNLSSKGAKIPSLPLLEGNLNFQPPTEIWKKAIPKPSLTYEDFIRHLSEIIESFGSYIDSLSKALELSEDLRLLVDNTRNRESESFKKRFSNLSRELEHLDVELLENSMSSRYTGPSIQKVIYYINENFGKLLDAKILEDEYKSVVYKSHLLYEHLYQSVQSQLKWLNKTKKTILQQKFK